MSTVKGELWSRIQENLEARKAAARPPPAPPAPPPVSSRPVSRLSPLLSRQEPQRGTLLLPGTVQPQEPPAASKAAPWFKPTSPPDPAVASPQPAQMPLASPAATPAQQKTPTPAAFHIEVVNVRPNHRQDRALFFDVRMLRWGIAIYDYSLCCHKGNTDVSLPGRPQLDSNPQLVIVPETGKPKYRKTVAFLDRATKRRCNAAVLAALKAACPEVFEPSPAESEPVVPEVVAS